MNNRMRKAWLTAVAALILSACTTVITNEPTKAERMETLSEVKTQLAVEFMREKDFRNAVKAIDDAIRANHRNEIAWMVKGVLYQTMKVNETADQSFRQALALKPDSAEVNNNYGWFLCTNIRQYVEAQVYFDRALADPTYPTPQVAYMNKGVCAARSGHFHLAQENLNRAVLLAPNFPEPIKEMARLRMMEGHLSEAVTFFNQYQSRVDVLSPDALLLGWKIARAKGDNQAAYDYEAQLRTNYPSSDEMKEILSGSLP